MSFLSGRISVTAPQPPGPPHDPSRPRLRFLSFSNMRNPGMTASPASALPTPERLARGEVVELETMQAGIFVHVDRKATLLDRYWRDQLLCPEGSYDRASARHEAGGRLAALYDAAGVRRRLMGAYEPRSVAYGEMTDDQAEAFRDYQALVGKMQRVSFGAASAVVNLCIHEFDPVDRRELIRGLDVLVRHWGL